jgi:hypothetical protein
MTDSKSDSHGKDAVAASHPIDSNGAVRSGEVIDFAQAKAAREAKDARAKGSAKTSARVGVFQDDWAAFGEDSFDSGAELIYDLKPGSVGVSLVEAPSGLALLTITAAAKDVAEELSHAFEAYYDAIDMDFPDIESIADDHRLSREEIEDGYDYALYHLRKHFFAQAVLRVGIIPFLEPQFVDVDENNPAEFPTGEQDYSFCAEVLVRPMIGLVSYDPVTVDFPTKLQVTDASVDDFLDKMSREMAELDASRAASLGKPVDPKSIKPVVIDNKFVKQNFPELGDLAGLRDYVRGMLERDAQREYEDELDFRTASELAKRLESDPPRRYVEALTETVLERRMRDLFRENPDAASRAAKEAGPEYERLRAESEEEATDTLRRAVALDAYGDHFDIQIDEQALIDTVRSSYANSSPDILIKLIDAGEIPRLCEVSLRRLANRKLSQEARPRGRDSIHLV